MSSMRLFPIFTLLIAGSAAAHAQLMIPDDNTIDRIMLFSEVDGSLIDADWITEVGASGWTFTTPKEVCVVNDELWVADQVEDAILRFDRTTRAFLGEITTRADGGLFDNLRGLGFDGTHVYQTLAPSGAANDGIATYLADGTPVAFFLTLDSPFDAEPFEGELLVSISSNDDVIRYTTGGGAGAAFALDLDFPQQVVVLPDDSVIVVASIGTAGVEGVHHLNADGSTRTFIDTEPIEEQVPRGAYPLEDGGYLVSTSTGIYKAVSNGGGGWTLSLVFGGGRGQYITKLPSTTPALKGDLDCSGAVNFFDVDPFLLALFDPAGYALAFPDCDINNGDINNDALVNFFDVDGFLACLFGTCP